MVPVFARLDMSGKNLTQPRYFASMSHQHRYYDRRLSFSVDLGCCFSSATTLATETLSGLRCLCCVFSGPIISIEW